LAKHSGESQNHALKYCSLVSSWAKTSNVDGSTTGQVVTCCSPCKGAFNIEGYDIFAVEMARHASV
jgi:hypothetical protein